MSLHWMTVYPFDDGEPVGQTCDCEIGEDHDVADLDDDEADEFSILAAPNTEKIAFRKEIPLTFCSDEALEVVAYNHGDRYLFLSKYVGVDQEQLEAMTAAEARQLAAALVEAADRIDPLTAATNQIDDARSRASEIDGGGTDVPSGDHRI